MRSVFRHSLPWSASLLVLCLTPIAYGQQVPDCNRNCERNYWKGVSTCYREHTLYNDIRQCQDAEEIDKRKCAKRCADPRSQEPGNCPKRCDREFWDDVSLCYRSSNRYSDIRACEDSARKSKDGCARSCSQRAKEVGP